MIGVARARAADFPSGEGVETFPEIRGAVLTSALTSVIPPRGPQEGSPWDVVGSFHDHWFHPVPHQYQDQGAADLLGR